MAQLYTFAPVGSDIPRDIRVQMSDVTNIKNFKNFTNAISDTSGILFLPSGIYYTSQIDLKSYICIIGTGGTVISSENDIENIFRTSHKDHIIF